MTYSIKSIREDFKSKGIFYTSSKQAEYMKSFIPEDAHEVYDPTCGHGNLLAVFPDEVKKYGQDINDFAIEHCQANIPNFIGGVADTLKQDIFADKQFKYIVANPPFSVKWTDSPQDGRFTYAPIEKGKPLLPPPNKADYAFNLHILDKLTDDGIAVVMNFPGVLYRGQREGRIRQYLVEQNLIDEVISIPPNQFEDTTVSTCVIVYRKNKTTTDIKFTDSEHGLSVVVPFEDVASNGFNLSVSQYVQIEKEEPEVDITAIANEVDKCSLEAIENSIKLKIQTHELDVMFGTQSMSVKQYLDCIQAIVKKYRQPLQPLDQVALF